MAETKAAIKKEVGKKKSSKKVSQDTSKSKSKTVLEPQAGGSSSSEDSVQGEQEEDTLQIGKGVGTAAVTVDREEYLQAHRDLAFDRSQLLLTQIMLSHFIRIMTNKKIHLENGRMGVCHLIVLLKRKMIHVLKTIEVSAEMEEKYQQKLFSYEELKEKSEREIDDIKSKVQAIEMQYDSRQEVAVEKFEALQTLERSTGTGLIYSKKGKPIADKTVARFLTLQRRKQEQSTSMCLRYIRARNAVGELDAIVKKLEKLGPGLYVYQFEQLHIDNQNLMTKIEEREDELIKNRSKCTEHNQMLAHIREKMNHTDEVIDFAECDLGDAEIEFYKAREELGTIKTRRDRLRYALDNERVRAGLLTRKDLLRDYQDATDEVVVLRKKKKYLEDRIVVSLNHLREARKRMQPDKISKASTCSFNFM